MCFVISGSGSYGDGLDTDTASRALTYARPCKTCRERGGGGGYMIVMVEVMEYKLKVQWLWPSSCSCSCSSNVIINLYLFYSFSQMVMLFLKKIMAYLQRLVNKPGCIASAHLSYLPPLPSPPLPPQGTTLQRRDLVRLYDTQKRT